MTTTPETAVDHGSVLTGLSTVLDAAQSQGLAPSIVMTDFGGATISLVLRPTPSLHDGLSLMHALGATDATWTTRIAASGEVAHRAECYPTALSGYRLTIAVDAP